MSPSNGSLGQLVNKHSSDQVVKLFKTQCANTPDDPLQNSGVGNSSQLQTTTHQDPFDPFSLGSLGVSTFDKPGRMTMSTQPS